MCTESYRARVVRLCCLNIVNIYRQCALSSTWTSSISFSTVLEYTFMLTQAQLTIAAYQEGLVVTRWQACLASTRAHNSSTTRALNHCNQWQQPSRKQWREAPHESIHGLVTWAVWAVWTDGGIRRYTTLTWLNLIIEHSKYEVLLVHITSPYMWIVEGLNGEYYKLQYTCVLVKE